MVLATLASIAPVVFVCYMAYRENRPFRRTQQEIRALPEYRP